MLWLIASEREKITKASSRSPSAVFEWAMLFSVAASLSLTPSSM
jgi:hypothetical protein